MAEPRFFIHASAASVEDMIDAAGRHGAVVDARAYLPPSGRGVYGSVEVATSRFPASGEDEKQEVGAP